MAEWVSPRLFRFMPATQGLLGKGPVLGALYLYWLIGRFQRRRPATLAHFSEENLLSQRTEALAFEEGMLRVSDSRFVLGWITPHKVPQGIALNYLELVDGGFGNGDFLWRLDLYDRLAERDLAARARLVDLGSDNGGVGWMLKEVRQAGSHGRQIAQWSLSDGEPFRAEIITQEVEAISTWPMQVLYEH